MRFFHITCGNLWAVQEAGTRPAAFPFMTGEKFWHHKSGKSGQRVLPVRGGQR